MNLLGYLNNIISLLNAGESEEAFKIRSRLNELSIDDLNLITADREIKANYLFPPPLKKLLSGFSLFITYCF